MKYSLSGARPLISITSPLAFLGSLIDSTSRIKLGTGVVSLPYHHEPQIMALGLSWDESHAYLDVRGGIDQGVPIEHRLLGWPDPVQNAEMELECQRATARIDRDWSATEEWRLLLQLASDDDVGMMWGDVGLLYFWIRDPDLAARAVATRVTVRRRALRALPGC